MYKVYITLFVMLLLCALENPWDIRDDANPSVSDRHAECAEHLLCTPLVNAASQLEAIDALDCELGPARDSELVRQVVHELLEVLALFVRELLDVLGQVLRDLLDHRVEPLDAEALDLGTHLRVGLDDFLARDAVVNGLDEVSECDGCLDSEEPEGDRVHLGIVELLVELCELDRRRETLPRPAARVLAAEVGILRRIEPLLLVGDVVDDLRNDVAGVGIACPDRPVFDGRPEVDDPESIEKCGVDLVHGVVRRDVDRGGHVRLRVKLPPVELTVQDDLERIPHDLMGRAVELVEEEQARLETGTLVPVRWVEASDLAVSGRKTDHVAFAHLRESTVDDLELREVEHRLPAPGELANDLRLSDAVITTEHDRSLGRETHSGLEKRLDRHRRSSCHTIFLWWWKLQTQCTMLVVVIAPSQIMVIVYQSSSPAM